MDFTRKYKTAWLIGSRSGIGLQMIEIIRERSDKLCYQ